MALAKITTIGFQTYLTNQNDDLFKNLSLPDGIDRETLLDNLMNESAEFEVLYSNPYYMQDLIGAWSKKHYRTWKKRIDALNLEYKPLWNYDRTEEWSDVTTHTGNTKDTYSNNTNANATTSDSATTTNKISAYDSNTFQNDTQATSSGNVTNNSSGSNSGDNTTTLNTKDSNIRTGKAYGNIGVTTSQQMLEAEYNVAKLNIYSSIIDMYIDEFCIPVYA